MRNVEAVGWLSEPSPKTVFFVGAGLLKNFSDRHGVRPPMALDLFRIAYQYREVHPLVALDECDDLRIWLKTYFRTEEDDLRSADVPIEEIFTLLESQATRGDRNAALALKQLEQLLIELLTDFQARWGVTNPNDRETSDRQPSVARAFGKALFDRSRPRSRSITTRSSRKR